MTAVVSGRVAVTTNQTAGRKAVIGLILSISAIVLLVATLLSGVLLIAFGVSGAGGIVPAAWILAVFFNLFPLGLGIAGTWLGATRRTTGLGIAAIVVGVLAALCSLAVIVMFTAIGLGNLPP